MDNRKSAKGWARHEGIPVRTGCYWVGYYKKERGYSFDRSENGGYLLTPEEWTAVKEWAEDRKKRRV